MASSSSSNSNSNVVPSTSSVPQRNITIPAEEPEIVLVNGYQRIDYDPLELSSDSDTDEEYEPVQQRDNVVEYVNEIITGIRRLTPAMRELAKSQIRLILQRYLRPDWADDVQRVPPSVPRKLHRNG